MNYPKERQIRDQTREIRRRFIKAGYSVQTYKTETSLSRYIMARKGHVSIKVRVSDHPPARRHRNIKMIAVHPGGANMADIDAAIKLGGIPPKPNQKAK